ncbi:hypothetical protein [Streptomyces sp. SID11385]|uniref:hypothetical protein n=1 Tax=unclassified Streptomyces TaxID=2593676 RepID=UPI001943DF04|nr:hypothetical protein [Streptomyces sp. SID11385]
MTERDSPRSMMPRLVVLAPQPSHPPFRVVEADGQVVGEATNVKEVVAVALALGLTAEDLDDPDKVLWVGGDQYSWTPR